MTSGSETSTQGLVCVACRPEQRAFDRLFNGLYRDEKGAEHFDTSTLVQELNIEFLLSVVTVGYCIQE